MAAITSTILSALTLKYLHNKSKKKAVKKAVDKVREKEVITDKFYILINDNKLDINDPHISKQDFLMVLDKVKSTIKTFNGTNIIHTNTGVGTMIFFDMPASSVLPLHNQLKKFHPGISIGRAKKN